MDKMLGGHVTSLKTASTRLCSLQSHDALVILKHFLSLPKLQHNLRSSFCANRPALSEFDDFVHKCLRSILNVSLDNEHWIQASLPVKSGGLEIRRATQIAPSAYLASASGSVSLVSDSSTTNAKCNGSLGRSSHGSVDGIGRSNSSFWCINRITACLGPGDRH